MTTETAKKPQLEESWLEIIGDEFEKAYMKQLKTFLIEEKRHATVYPKGSLIFNARSI